MTRRKWSSHDPAVLTGGSLPPYSLPSSPTFNWNLFFLGSLKQLLARRANRAPLRMYRCGGNARTTHGGKPGWCGHSAVVSHFWLSLCVPQAEISRLGENKWPPFYWRASSPCPSACPTRHRPPLRSRAAAFCSCIVTPAVFLLCVGKRCSDVRSVDRIAWLLMSPMTFQ